MFDEFTKQHKDLNVNVIKTIKSFYSSFSSRINKKSHNKLCNGTRIYGCKNVKQVNYCSLPVVSDYTDAENNWMVARLHL